MSTELYRSVMDQTEYPILHDEWSPFPWMVNFYIGSHDTDRRHDIWSWLHDRLGNSAFRAAGKDGLWNSGSFTIFGWEWLGFVNEDDMNALIETFPHPNTED